LAGSGAGAVWPSAPTPGPVAIAAASASVASVFIELVVMPSSRKIRLARPRLARVPPYRPRFIVHGPAARNRAFAFHRMFR
jgi:hypothetical protein